VLNSASYSSSFMTQDTCSFWCQAKGYALAGISGSKSLTSIYAFD
jgi:hypothetical protein